MTPQPTQAPLAWPDLRGRRVGIWGVGVEGQASLRRLRADGQEPLLVARSAGVLDDGTEVVAFDAGGAQLLASCDVVVKTPGISPYSAEARLVRAGGAELVGGLGLWLNGVDRVKVACLTGTKGKSTTTSIAAGLLDGLGAPYGVGGNIGVCPWDPEVEARSSDADWWVIETSSYQAVDVVLGPAVVGVTSLGEDHLPWHQGSVETYVRDKLSLCTRPGVRHVIANGADRLLRTHAARLGQVEWVDDPAGLWADSRSLLGTHNRRNAEIARRVLVALGVPGADDEALLAEAFRAFVPLPHRLTPVVEVDGVTFVDDSISTTVLSAAAAVESFADRRVGLLVGGYDRALDYRPLRATAARSGVRLFTMPTNGPLIAKVLRAEGIEDVVECGSLAEAVEAAFAWARPGGVVLLSPAAASFDLFSDYRARGDAFAAVARILADSPTAPAS